MTDIKPGDKVRWHDHIVTVRTISDGYATCEYDQPYPIDGTRMPITERFIKVELLTVEKNNEKLVITQ